MQYQLRDYQDGMSAAIVKGFELGRPFAAVAATAAGKSLIIADVVKRLNGKPVLVLQPSKEILEQNYAKMLAYGLDAKVYSASMNSKEIGAITLATIGSIYKTPEKFQHFEYALIDECHLVAPKKANTMYLKFFREADIRRVGGLTATPFRLENKFVKDGQALTYTGCIQMINRITRAPFFRSIVYKVEMADLIAKGYLTQPEYHTYEVGTEELQVNGSGTNYTDDSVEQWSNSKLGNLLMISKELDARHKRVLVFCSSLAQCGKAVGLLEAQGIHAETLDGTTPKKIREDMIARFQSGELKWIVNVGTMTTGFDCPALDAVVLLRPTMSLSLYIQILGRCVRIDPNDPSKTAHFYDFTGTVNKFGHAEEIKVVKEDGFKDMLVNGHGQRVDNQALFSFEVKRDVVGKKKKDTKPTVADLLAKV